MKNSTSIFLLVLSILFSSCSNDDNTISPSPDDQIIRGIAVGIGGTIISTTDFGDSWLLQTSGTEQILRAVAFRNKNIITVVGDSGIILRTNNGGDTWVRQSSGITLSLNGILNFGASTWIAVGNGGTILRTTNDGVTWLGQISETGDDINAITCCSGDTVIAVVTGGYILRSTDAGVVWTMQRPSVDHLTAIKFINANNGIVVGWNGEILQTSDSGRNWQSKSSGTIDYILGVSFLDTNNIMAIANYGSENAKFLSTTNGGTNWTIRNATTYGLYGISFADTTHGIAVGYNGIILRTTDGGIQWEGKIAITNKWLFGISFNALH